MYLATSCYQSSDLKDHCDTCYIQAFVESCSSDWDNALKELLDLSMVRHFSVSTLDIIAFRL